MLKRLLKFSALVLAASIGVVVVAGVVVAGLKALTDLAVFGIQSDEPLDLVFVPTFVGTAVLIVERLWWFIPVCVLASFRVLQEVFHAKER